MSKPSAFAAFSLLPAFPAYYTAFDKLGWLGLRLGALLVLAFLLLPIVAIVPLSFSSSSFLAYPIEGWSLQWYDNLFSSEEWSRATRNSFIVAPLATVLATVLGTLIGIGRLSNNMLVRGLCTVHVEVTRNVPLLLQLFMWYFAMTELLPTIEDPFKPLASVFLSKNGLQYPLPEWSTGHWGTVIGLIAGAVAWRFWARRAIRQFEITGQYHPARTHLIGLGILLAVPAIALWLPSIT